MRRTRETSRPWRKHASRAATVLLALIVMALLFANLATFHGGSHFRSWAI